MGESSRNGATGETVCPACGSKFRAAAATASATCPVCRYAFDLGHDEEIVEAEVVADDGYEPSWSRSDQPPDLSGPCAVCAATDERLDLLAVSGIVASACGEPELTVRQRIARSHGVFARGVQPGAAESVVGALNGMGAAAFAVPEDVVAEDVEKVAGIIRVYDVTDAGLSMQVDVHGNVRNVPWPAVKAGFCTKLHAERGGATKLERVGASDDLIGPNGARSHTRYRAAPRPREADVDVTFLVSGRSRKLYSMKISDKRVRYVYLGARRTPSSAGNLPLFLNDVMARCPGGFFPLSTRLVAQGNKMRVQRLRDKREYLNYLEWVTCCVGYLSTGGRLA